MRRSSRELTLLKGSLVTAAVTVLLLAPVWVSAVRYLSAPWGAGDMTFYYFYSATWSWWRHAFVPEVAFPWGLDPNVFAGLDGLTHLLAQPLNWVFGNPFAGLNLLLLLSFPMCAVGAYLLIRYVGLGGPLAVALAVAFTFIPYHFGRGIGHLHLGLLTGAVAGVALAILTATGAIDRYLGAPASISRSVGRWLSVVLLVIVATWSGLYYAAFTVLLVAAALLWRLARASRICAAARSAVVWGLSITTTVIGLVPVLLARATAPDVAATGVREPMESVTYAGNVLVTLLPQPNSVVSASYNEAVLDLFAEATQTEPVLMANFGSWVTLLSFAAWAVGLATQARLVRTGTVSDAGRVPGTLVAYLLGATLLFFVPWGLNYLFATLGTAQIRAWNRLAPILLLLAIIGAASALASWRWPARRAATFPVAGILLAVTLIESVLPWRNLYATVPAAGQVRLDNAERYATLTAASLPPDCSVLTFPFITFLNAGPRVGMDDYDHYLHWLVSPERPISYGAYAGSEAAQRLGTYTEALTPEQVAELRALGYCGVHVDAAGYGYGDADSVLSYLGGLLGPPVASVDRWTMFRL